MTTGIWRTILKRPPLSYGWACRCCRSFSYGPATFSGHSRWSKIKHDKGKTDKGRSKERTVISRDISAASRLYGPDRDFNPRLAQAIASAKRAGLPKASIDSAIARGQGRSTSGAVLESLTVEAILPSSVASVIECQTDEKARALQDIRNIIKTSGGTVTPTSYLFEKKGRIVFEKVDGIQIQDIFDAAIEAGAKDVDTDEDGRLIVDTEPAQTKSIAQTLAEATGLKVESSEIIWDPNRDTMVELESDKEAKELNTVVSMIQEDPSVQDVYINAC